MAFGRNLFVVVEVSDYYFYVAVINKHFSKLCASLSDCNLN